MVWEADLSPYGESAEFGGSSSSYQVQEVKLSEVAPMELVEESSSQDSQERLKDTEESFPACCCSSFSATRPLMCVGIGWSLILLVVSIGLAALPFRIETNFDSFLISDVESSLHRAAFNSATASRSTGAVRRLQAQASSANAYSTKDLFIGYSLAGRAGHRGILTAKSLSQISRLEQSLRETPGFAEFCNQTDELYHGLCNPGLSFSSYALPTLNITEGNIVPNSMTLDGMGFDPVPLRTAYLVAKEHNLADLFLPTGYDPDVEEGAQVLRSLFRFRFVVGTARDKVEDRVAASKVVDSKWEAFFTDVLVPALGSSDMVTSFKDDMHVWFDGTGFRDFEVYMAVINDVPLAIGSAVFILAYMLAHTRSLLLAVVGPLLAMLSVPITWIICGAILGNSTVNFANFLAVFLAIGFGADVMFVYYDAWTQSEGHAEQIPNRLAWTYQRAVKASLATTSTTALSFLCNMASVIRALRQFGFFMGICVLITWLSLTFIYVPTIVIDYIWCRRVRLSSRRLTGSKSACFGSWALVLYRIRYCILFLTIVFMVICVSLALPALTVGTGMPDVFPDQHNQNTGVEVLAQFEPVSIAFTTSRQDPPREVLVCQGADFASTATSCVMQWCEARYVSDEPTWEGNGTCTCKRRMTTGCSGSAAPVRVRFVGPSSLTDLQLSLHVVNHLFAWPDATSLDLSVEARRDMIEEARTKPQLLQQVWDTGETSLSNTMEISVGFTRQETSSCGWDEICFCGNGGTLQCILDTWDGTSTLDLPALRRLQATTETTTRTTGMLTSSTVPISKRTKVRAVFGIYPETTVMLLGERPPEDTWSYNPGFDLSDPWAQRAMYQFCSEIPLHLMVTRKWCWFEDFREFSKIYQGRFPVKAVDWAVVSKLYVDTSTKGTRGTKYIWLEEDVVKGMYVSFELGISRDASNEEVLDLKEKWDKYGRNWKKPDTASPYFLVSDEWVAVESASRLITSTASSLAILCVLALACMLIFTHSCILSVVVVVSTVMVIIVLSFFITVVMGWEVGLIEVIAFIYFIGYAVDYSLHMVYKYGSNDALTEDDQTDLGAGREKASLRLQRMSFALKTMGGATVGSAITTAGSSLFLVFCTLTIFAKLGAMCFTVTMASILFALCPLGAYLMTLGPVRPGLCNRCYNQSAQLLDDRRE